MMHIIPQTRDEKLAVYMKLTKRAVAEMLVNCNDALDSRPPAPVRVEATTWAWYGAWQSTTTDMSSTQPVNG